MAKRVVVEVTDDLDGTPADEKIHFGLDGVSYEIDLSRANAAELRDTLATYVAYARKEGRTPMAAPRTPSRVETDVDASAVRAWARANDVEVNPRGRIPTSVVDRFRAAGN